MDVEQYLKSNNIEQGGRSLIDLSSKERQNLDFDGYILSKVFDDIILVDLIDEDESGNVKRNGIFIPTGNTIKTWRKGIVLLTGKSVTQCKKNDIVIFPHDMGCYVTNVTVKDYGKLKKGIFLNEERIFGCCEKNNE